MQYGPVLFAIAPDKSKGSLIKLFVRVGIWTAPSRQTFIRVEPERRAQQRKALFRGIGRRLVNLAVVPQWCYAKRHERAVTNAAVTPPRS